MLPVSRFGLLALVALPFGCARPAPAASAHVAPADASAATSAPAPPSSAPAATSPGGERCGALECTSYATAAEAFERVLAERPAALGIGEAHAQKGSEGVASATKRFTDDLLPALKGKASFLLVELMLPNDACTKTTQHVAKQQEAVTKPQAATNQNEYVVLGQRARALGIVPDLLRPSCDDLDAIAKAGGDDVDLMLRTIARLSTKVVSQELDRNAAAGADRVVVSYGGALHNDVAPKPDHAAWSYGPALAEKTKGRYVELDLIVPEYVKDADAWRALAWYPHYDRAKLGGRAVLYRVGPSSWTLILPASSPAGG